MAVIARDTLIDGRYRVRGRLGAGGMADVYCADDLQLGRTVAVKLLHRRFAEDAEFVERFRREASAAAGLNHPNVVSVYDRGEWDGTSYIAMEYLAGRTLKELVRDAYPDHPLHPDLAVDLVIQVLEAARFAHRRGIVHRDLKPHNVIVDDEGRATVTDFGLARAGASDMTETGSIMGTAQYLSPEQAQGRPVDARSDLYSIGVLLYELLTGVVPFDAESPVSVALKHVSEAPVPPAQRNPAVPPALDGVVLRAMAKDPGRRFQDADAFIAALQDAVRRGAGPPPPAAPEPMAPPEAEEGRRNRAAVVALVVLALVAAAVAAWALFLRAPDRPVPDVLGATVPTATERLQDAGFEVRSVPVQSDTVRDGRVAGQDPEAGGSAPEGSTVTIRFSSGPGENAVPDTEGQTGDAAAAAVRDAGFEVARRREYSDSVREGRVIASTPAAGATITRGRTVTLVISRGPEPVAVPDVTGGTREEAEAALEAAGLRADVSRRESTEEEPGTVLEQDPGAGASVRPGSTVALVVAEAPPEAPVPDLSGLTEEEARQAIEDAGFTVRARDQPTVNDAEDGRVVAQNPPPGEPREQGRAVAIAIGRFEPEDVPPGDELPPPDEGDDG